MMRKLMITSLVILFCVSLATLVAAETKAPCHKKGMKSPCAKVDCPKGCECKKAKASRPDRIHKGQRNKTWRERINTVARHPEGKDKVYPQQYETPSPLEHHEWRGVRDLRPLVARKLVRPKKVRKTREERVDIISRGPIEGR